MEVSALYTITSQREEEGARIYEIQLNPNHKVFRGHFPEMPVMPGVCMLRLIKDCVNSTSGKPMRFGYLKSCKFVSVVDPRKDRVLTVSFTLSEMNLQATVSAGEATALKLKATLTEA